MSRRTQNDNIQKVVEDITRTVVQKVMNDLLGEMLTEIDAAARKPVAKTPKKTPARQAAKRSKKTPTPPYGRVGGVLTMSDLVQTTGIDQGNLRRVCMRLNIYRCYEGTPAHILQSDFPKLLDVVRTSTMYRGA